MTYALQPLVLQSTQVKWIGNLEVTCECVVFLYVINLWQTAYQPKWNGALTD